MMKKCEQCLQLATEERPPHESNLFLTRVPPSMGAPHHTPDTRHAPVHALPGHGGLRLRRTGLQTAANQCACTVGCSSRSGCGPDPAVIRNWWTVFGDPLLTTYIEAAAAQNLDLKTAVARTYLVVRTAQARLAATEGNITSQRQVMQLTQSRFKFGLATDLDVAQAEDVLANSEARVPPLRSIMRQSINTLALLLGRPPGSFDEELIEVKPIPIPPEQVTVGVPADIVRRRPDIRRAERALAAETARIGVATADLYPRFTLLGTLGLEATDATKLFARGSTFYSMGPSMRWDIFDGARIRSQFKVADARTEQALLQYEQSVLKGLTEVENAMTALTEERNLADVGNLVGATERTLLTTLVRDDPIYAYFSVSERDLLSYREHPSRMSSPTSNNGNVPVFLGLSSQSDYPYEGRIDFVNNRLDPSTGTIQVRGLFQNSDGRLLPGLFARVRVPIGTTEQALLVPERTVGTDQRGEYLLVVNAQHMVEVRTVTMGPLLKDQRAIRKGISAEDRVIVDEV
jgi:multidrug efflux pump subunit AcrA (membrane-fusion protein)